ncbi:MAG TPA: hypothetical protein VFQ61_30275 [Polyangiaceae bacterium]|nr:hypothetical protein [Polyangiaceae bacterium]
MTRSPALEGVRRVHGARRSSAFGAASALLLALLWTARARADGYAVDGTLGVGSGMQAGDAGSGMAWSRARLRLQTGFDLMSDELPNQAVGFRGFVELERRGSVGLEARYTRWLGRGFGGFVFGSAAFMPETLVGGGVGFTLVIPLGSRVGLGLEPAFAAFPLGSDLPEGSFVFLAGLSAGVRVRL